MNWEYLITPWQVYHTNRIGWDRFSIDWQNKIKYKQWKKIEEFDSLKYKVDFPLNIRNALDELGEITHEKWNLVIFKNKHWENIYLYNSTTKLEAFDNEFIYSNILFEDRKDQIINKTEDFCNYALSNNIKSISNVAKLATIKNKEEFIQNVSNQEYINSSLTDVDDRLLEDIFLLWKGCHIWYFWEVYLYAFLESSWKLIPAYFNYETLADYDIPSDVSYDKIEVIMNMEWKEKISLFIMKVLEDTMVFKQDVIAEEDLQAFYNNLFVKYNPDNKKEQ